MWPFRKHTPDDWNRSLAALGMGAALVCGLILLNEAAWRLSGTYDEVTYLELAALWWKTGNQEAISRMGSPLTFWKIQQAPAFWLLEQAGAGVLLDHPLEFQNALLPVVRIFSVWIWLASALVTSLGARSVYGRPAGVMAAWLFALGPNLLGHGALITMEMPLVAASAAAFWAFAQFLETGRRSYFLASALAAGLAFSCKFTGAVLPVLLAGCWWLKVKELHAGNALHAFGKVLTGSSLYVALMLATNGLLTGGASLTLSESVGEHPALVEKLGPTVGGWATSLVERPWPQDWVGFANQMKHQSHGGPSYLLGERRNFGWRSYYLIALLAKVPLAIMLLALIRLPLGRISAHPATERLITIVPLLFCVIASLGSTRNYGFRYLLLVTSPAIVWLSGVASIRGWPRWLGLLATLLLGLTTLANQPHFLSYFNELAGGRTGGKYILADSNLDWGQGAKALAHLQQIHPELQNLTTYYFGSTDPGFYGVCGTRFMIDAGEVHLGLPEKMTCATEFLAVSTSLQWGPWGPAKYFQALNNMVPDMSVDDGTMAIYRNPVFPEVWYPSP